MVCVTITSIISEGCNDMRGLLATSIAAAISLTTVGQVLGLDDEIRRHPEPTVVEYYAANEPEMLSLREAIAAPGDQRKRLEAFETLITKFPAGATITARKYVTDPDEQVALLAIELLKGSLVMSDHHTVGAGALLPRQRYMLDVHNASRKSLRSAVTDGRAAVRNAAAGFLASLSDDDALKAIETGNDNGLYSDVEAANLFTLASGDAGLPYLEKYLGKGDENAQLSAIGYLGSFPKYQDQIRIVYFTNADASPVVRTQAAKTLGEFDPSFPQYALVVANEENVDPKLYQVTVTGYVNTQVKEGKLDPGSAKIVSGNLKHFLEIPRAEALSEDVTVELLKLNQRLEALSTTKQ